MLISVIIKAVKDALQKIADHIHLHVVIVIIKNKE